MIETTEPSITPAPTEWPQYAARMPAIQYMSLNSHDVIHIMGEIYTANPDAVDFPLDQHVVASIAMCLMFHRFETILLRHGINFTLALLSYFQEREQYEACAAIVACVEFVNATLHTDFVIPSEIN